jgi:hypothetical protein
LVRGAASFGLAAFRERLQIIGMAELGSLRMCQKLAALPVAAAAASALLAGTAFAQYTLRPPPVVSPSDFPAASAQTQNYRAKRARENAYRRALKKIPDKKATKAADPWADMRSAASSEPHQQ